MAFSALPSPSRPPSPWQLVRDMWFAVLEHRLERIIEDSGASPPFDEAYAGCFSFEGAPMATFTAYPPEQEGWAAALLGACNDLAARGA